MRQCYKVFNPEQVLAHSAARCKVKQGRNFFWLTPLCFLAAAAAQRNGVIEMKEDPVLFGTMRLLVLKRLVPQRRFP